MNAQIRHEHTAALDTSAPGDHSGHMVVTSIATLKASLSEFLAGVKAGEEVVVTDRGRPVARIVPYDPGGAELDELVRTGRLRRSHGPVPPGFWTRPRPADPEGRLLRALLDEREADR
jgi:prevent-host-death family protein